MRSILHSILILLLFSNPLLGQSTYIDANNWYYTDCEGTERMYFFGFQEGVNRYFRIGGLSEVLTLSDIPDNVGEISWPTTGVGDFSDCVLTLTSPGTLYMRQDFTSFFYVIHRNGISYTVTLPINDLGLRTIRGVPMQVYYCTVVLPNTTSLQTLEATNGLGTTLNPNENSDSLSTKIDQTIDLLKQLDNHGQEQIDLLKQQHTQKQHQINLSEQLTSLEQYQIGLLAFTAGMILFYIFARGLHR